MTKPTYADLMDLIRANQKFGRQLPLDAQMMDLLCSGPKTVSDVDAATVMRREFEPKVPRRDEEKSRPVPDTDQYDQEKASLLGDGMPRPTSIPVMRGWTDVERKAYKAGHSDGFNEGARQSEGRHAALIEETERTAFQRGLRQGSKMVPPGTMTYVDPGQPQEQLEGKSQGWAFLSGEPVNQTYVDANGKVLSKAEARERWASLTGGPTTAERQKPAYTEREAKAHAGQLIAQFEIEALDGGYVINARPTGRDGDHSINWTKLVFTKLDEVVTWITGNLR